MQERTSQRREQSPGPAPSVAVLDPCYEPLLAVVRGRAVESVHRGAIAVVDIEGTLLGGVGDPAVEVLLRSAAKPFQAAVLVESGAAEAFSLSNEEVAVIAASHAGAPEHVELVEGMLRRAGLSGASLVCGSAEHMCSGKHTGMLLLARHLGVASDGYEREEHPVQREIARYMASLLDACPRRPANGVEASARSSPAAMDAACPSSAPPCTKRPGSTLHLLPARPRRLPERATPCSGTRVWSRERRVLTPV